MNNEKMAIKWGVGYQVLSPPYREIEFVYGYMPPDNVRVVTTFEACEILTKYLHDNGIKEYEIKRGLMAFKLIDGAVVIQTNRRGRAAGSVNKPKVTRVNRAPHIPTLLAYIRQSEKIDKKWLVQLVGELKGIATIISKDMGVEKHKIWKMLFSFDDEAYLYRNSANKMRVMSHYSGGEIKCKRCGLTDIRALSIDHMHGGGMKMRRELKQGLGDNLYRWLIKNNYPDGYQVLCMSCQWIKRVENHECAGTPNA